MASILVVDDEDTIRKLLVMILELQPWHVDAVGTAEEGLELCHDPCVDMIIGVYAIRPVSR